MELLDIAKAALLYSLIVMIVGSAWRLGGILMHKDKPDHSVARQPGGYKAALKVIWTRSLGAPAFKKENVHLKTLGYSMHIGLFTAILFSQAHIAKWSVFLGFGWPGLPDVAISVVAILTVAILLVMMYRRLSHPVLKLISNFDDYMSWFVTILPLLTGLAIPVGFGLAEDTLVAIHLFSVALLLLWFPFGKLTHAYMIFMSRGKTGMILERRGART
jgi:nitrate reductase gamma subunit